MKSGLQMLLNLNTMLVQKNEKYISVQSWIYMIDVLLPM